MIFAKLGRPKGLRNSVPRQSPKYEVRLNGVLLAVSPSEAAAHRTAEIIPGALVMRRVRGGSLSDIVKGRIDAREDL